MAIVSIEDFNERTTNATVAIIPGWCSPETREGIYISVNKGIDMWVFFVGLNKVKNEFIFEEICLEWLL